MPSKRALIIGIDDYPIPQWRLKGCVNDALDVYNLLSDHYKFHRDEIRLLTNYRATKENILSNLRNLVSLSEKRDVLVFYFSGHGTQIRDKNGDELSDNLDESLVAYDHNWESPLLDDDIAKVLKYLSRGVRMYVIMDCCHSGTNTREISMDDLYIDHQEDSGSYSKKRFIAPPLDYLIRQVDRDLEKVKVLSRRTGLNHAALSACQDHESAMEALHGNEVRGAFTFYLSNLLRKESDLSLNDIKDRLPQLLKNAGYSQNPYLEGTKTLLKRKIFT